MEFDIVNSVEDAYNPNNNLYIRVLHKRIEQANLPVDSQRFRKTAEEDIEGFLNSIHVPFFVLKNWKETINVNVVKNCFKGLVSFLNLFSNELKEHSRNGSRLGDNEEQLKLQRSAFKMAVYLLCEFGVRLEKMSMKAEKEATAMQTGRKKRKQSLADTDPLAGHWKVEKKESIVAVLRLFKQDVDSLWNPPGASRDVLNCVLTYAYLLLDSPMILYDNLLLEQILTILAIFIKRYSHEHAFCQQILNKMLNVGMEENDIKSLGRGVAGIIEKNRFKPLLKSFLLQFASPENDNDRSAKGLAFLLSAFGEKLFYYMPELSDELFNILEIDNHLLRSAALSVIGDTLIGVFNHENRRKLELGNVAEEESKILDFFLKQPDPLKVYLDNQDDFSTALFEHIHDLHSAVRARVLGIWEVIYEKNSVSVDFIVKLVERVALRLYDKAAYVRKSAFNFLCSVIRDHPFSDDILKRPQSEILQESEQKRIEVEEKLKSFQENESEAEVDNDVAQKKKNLNEALHFIDSEIKFVKAITQVFPKALSQLKAKQSTDRSVAIKFFALCNSLGVIEAENGVKEILPLIWSEEETVRKVVIDAFKGLFWGEDDCPDNRKQSIDFVAKVSKLVENASYEEFDAISDIIGCVNLSPAIMNSIRQILWERFTRKLQPTSEEESRCALQLLTMIAKCERAIFTDNNVDVLITEGIEKRGRGDFTLAKLTFDCLLQMIPPGVEGRSKKDQAITSKNKGKISKAKLSQEKRRYSNEDPLIRSICNLIVDGFTDKSQKKFSYIYMVESALKFLMEFADNCIIIYDTILQQLMELLKKNISTEAAPGSEQEMELDDLLSDDNERCSFLPVYLVTRFIFIIGHMGLQCYVYLKTDVLVELQNRKKNKKLSISPNFTPQVNAGGLSFLDSMNDSQNLETEDETERIDRVCDEELVTSNLLGKFSQFIIDICRDSLRRDVKSKDLQVAAAGALCKYMIVSKRYCEDNLQLVFSLIRNSPLADVRLICIVSVGDMMFNHISEVNEWNAKLYDQLSDKDPRIRKATLAVLCRCFEYGIIKIKGNHLGQVALCLVDKERRIVDEARNLFKIYAKRQEIIYNAIQNVVTYLVSSTSESRCDEDDFKKIIDYLIQFLTKVSEHESFGEKLCAKMKTAVDERQWRQLAYCFTKIMPTPKVVNTLNRKIADIADKLSEPFVRESLRSLISTAKKMNKGNEPEIAELEDKIRRVLTGETFNADLEDESPMKPRKTPDKRLVGRGRGKGRKPLAKKSQSNWAYEMSSESD
ncbi:DgyrCDS10237 [Dimorphilus gyrociliatus]|uniref:DgyrCDS10237 n=1 Tax=Dimorphilus gyrociliatus TaxID=2664684 RepID=A0A7I8VZM1_9ANNE|nr:DgyrCDS10237 [Dimorphilus gyrociliatus]